MTGPRGVWVWLRRLAKRGDGAADSADRYTVLSVRTIVVWAVLIVAVGVGVAVWLLLAFTGGDEQANRNQLDAVRTAGTIVVGTGGAAALLLAARWQRATEIALRQQERATDITDHDAAERRVTELYTKAADQLGSDKAPVRLAGLYALERLAQNNPDQRQTIVNVLCAYVRTPYTLPGDPPDPDTIPEADARKKLATEHRERTQEREVRLAAQGILAHHLRPGDDPDHPVDTFWKDLDLDLTAATLIDLDLNACAIRTGTFRGATFSGDAEFGRARVQRRRQVRRRHVQRRCQVWQGRVQRRRQVQRGHVQRRRRIPLGHVQRRRQGSSGPRCRAPAMWTSRRRRRGRTSPMPASSGVCPRRWLGSWRRHRRRRPRRARRTRHGEPVEPRVRL